MAYKKTFLTIIVFFFVLSCTQRPQQSFDLEQELKSRHSFNGYLALEYLQYGRDLAVIKKNNDSKYFTDKGLRASRDEDVFPEAPEKWGLNSTQIEEATLARAKLTALLADPKIRQTLPIQLARLQLLYDCWVSKENYSWQYSDMGQCQIMFFRLEKEMNDYVADLKPKKEIKVTEIKDPELSKFEIYFDLGSYKFNSEANKTFRELFINLEELNGDYRILLVGNADRVGKKLYNDIIARKRILAVKNLLVKNGIPQDFIEAKSLGDRSPQIITYKDTQNKYNRRVSIYVSKGKDSLDTIPLPLLNNYIYKKEIAKAKKERGLN